MKNSDKMKKLGKEIVKELPFKDPFLFIDRIVEFSPSKKVVAKKKLTGKEWFFKGHFPGNPVMPGHLIAEAMGQASVFLYADRFNRNSKVYLVGSKCRFFSIAKPGDTLTLKAFPVKILSTAAIVKTEAYVRNRLISKGEFAAKIDIPKKR